MPDRDPTDVSRELNSARLERLAGSKALKDALKEQVEADIRFDSAMVRKDIEIYHSFTERAARLPSVELRRALALNGSDRLEIEGIDGELYAEALKAKANVEAIKARLKGLEYSIDALRSELSSLRAEFTHA